MSLEEKIMTDLKAAMIAKDKNALDSLRSIKSAIILAKTAEGAGGEIKEEDEIKLLQKLVKQRKDSLEIYEKQNRPELAAKEKEELAIIEKFLPAQMSEEEIRAEVSKIITSSGASSVADMGKTIGLVNKQLAGKAEGKVIAAIVKELLATDH
ncbi:MAG: GatB/YqeY domain-containing protein [Chitinophagaceae bacterium]